MRVGDVRSLTRQKAWQCGFDSEETDGAGFIFNSDRTRGVGLPIISIIRYMCIAC